jgi:hypothetical protein
MSKDKALWGALAASRFKPIAQFKSLFVTLNTVKGKPLDAAQRADMEELLGCDFRDVRIYDDRQAGEIARQLNAEAFTVGNKVFAAREKLNTATLAGKALLAHELTHVAQQTQQAVSKWPTVEQPPPFGEALDSNVMSLRAERSNLKDIERVATSSLTGASGDLTRQAMEGEAQAVERLVRDASETMSLQAERSNPKAVEIDTKDIADRVYHLMQSELILEKERARV